MTPDNTLVPINDLDEALHQLTQRIYAKGTANERKLLTAIASIHRVSCQMSQPNGDDSAYSRGVEDMAGTALHLLRVTLTGSLTHLAPDTDSA